VRWKLPEWSNSDRYQLINYTGKSLPATNALAYLTENDLDQLLISISMKTSLFNSQLLTLHLTFNYTLSVKREPLCLALITFVNSFNFNVISDEEKKSYNKVPRCLGVSVAAGRTFRACTSKFLPSLVGSIKSSASTTCKKYLGGQTGNDVTRILET